MILLRNSAISVSSRLFNLAIRSNHESTRFASLRVAIVGSGPAGFYTTQRLLKHPDVKVDIYEKLPVPFGLVRYGVAPDHQDVKNVINSFTTIANNDRVDFYGNVSVNQDITLDELIDAYHVVVLCYGAAQDKYLNIEGENSTTNTISARNFVGWYNGVPEDKDLDVDLDCDTACIIGHGNVALDCARILLRPRNLDKTDITSYAQKRIQKSRVKKIYLIGRRGPLQVSFTTKELREIIKLNENGCRLDPSTIFDDFKLDLSTLKTISRQRRRLTELLLNVSINRAADEFDETKCIFKFMSKPFRIIANEENKVEGLDLIQTKYRSLEEFMDPEAKPVDSNEVERIKCGLIIRSIGYKAVMLDKNLPMDVSQGSIMNTNGRVHGYTSLYCSGWLATGASGVIAGTLNSSQVTAKSILDDVESRSLPNLTRMKPGFDLIGRKLRANSKQVVHFNDWLRIDEVERRLGDVIGKNREKLVDISTMLGVARGESNDSKPN